jgi:hypothetical protein
MLPFGEATSPDATTVPAGIAEIVGLGNAALAGPGVAGWERAGFGVSVGVDGVGVLVAVWLE